MRDFLSRLASTTFPPLVKVKRIFLPVLVVLTLTRPPLGMGIYFVGRNVRRLARPGLSFALRATFRRLVARPATVSCRFLTCGILSSYQKAWGLFAGVGSVPHA